MRTLERREFLAAAAAGLWAAASTAAGAQQIRIPSDAARYNVLHIMADDLRCCLGCYGHPEVATPNIDRLAARGVRFDRAYCQFPLCNPSRASYMTGLRPNSTRVYENETQFRANVPDVVTLPQSFQSGGYTVARVGKIYHYGVPRQIGTDGLDDPPSWERVVNPRGRDVDDIGVVEVLQLGPNGVAETVTGKQLRDTGGTLSWLAADGSDDEQTDGRGAAAARELLGAFVAAPKPFYLAVGFYRPHTPFVAPRAYFERYPLDSIELPEAPDDLDERFPRFALASQRPAELAMDDDLRRRAIQAYYASTTFMDAQVGRLLAAVDELGLADSTVVLFHSDHGYHLGEKRLWQKMSLFEESTRVPLIIAPPSASAPGSACLRPVELVSLHKTLTDVCGIPPGPTTEGYSLRPLVESPAGPWSPGAYTQVTRQVSGDQPRRRIMGSSLRTERWRYTEWDEGREGVELYDHDSDPLEMANLAANPRHSDTVAGLRDQLRSGAR